jgi:Ca-activated chloride channel family protein
MPEIVETVPVTFTARVEPDMTVPASALNWTLLDSTGDVLLGPVEAPGGNVRLLPGDYRLTVERVSQGTTHQASFTVSAGQPRDVVVPLPALTVDVTLSARIGGADGPLITDPILWEVAGVEATMDAANPYMLGLTRGAYSVTAYWTVQEVEQSADFVIVDQPREIALVFDEPVPQASVTAPASAVAGSTIEVGWSGPEEEHDFIAIRAPDAQGYHRFANSTRITEGNPLPLLMPSQPGDYLVEYIRNDGRTALASSPITVSPAEASVTAPATATAGETIEVGWTGPDYRNDFIAVRHPDSAGYHRFANSVGTDRGNPARLLMPSEPGSYVIEYIEGQDRTPLASVSIEVAAVGATLTAPATATAGETIEVGWTGPDYDNDFIAVRSPDAEGYHRFANTVGTDRGNPARLLMPTRPGNYVIEYIEAQDRTPLASVAIEIAPAAASLTAPATATVGDEVEIGWTGPNYRNDFIAIRRPDSEGYHRFAETVGTDRGNPAALSVPSQPGDYVIEYIEGQDRTPLAVSEITVSEAQAGLTAPASAEAGATIEVGWVGPDAEDDFIGIGRVDAEGGARWENYVYTREGNPIRLRVPPRAGEYAIRYFLGQDSAVLTSAPITVTPASASLTLPSTAVAGSSIEVGWTGPGNDGDFIGIGAAGAEGGARWQNYTYTREGNPLRVAVPAQPGTYDVRYFMDQDNTVIATSTIEVSAASASLTAPSTAQAGTTLEVGWTGPGYDGDFIAIGPAGAEGGARWQAYRYTREGNPAQIALPDDPGAYVLRYFMDEDNTPIAEVPITLE